MALKLYERPMTDVVIIRLSNGVLLQGDPSEETSDVFANKHHWDDDRFVDELDDSPFTHTTPSLWEE